MGSRNRISRKSPVFSDENSYAVLADASQELGKNILILSENREMNILAAKYDFGILQSEKKERKNNKEKVQLLESDEGPEQESDEGGQQQLEPDWEQTSYASTKAEHEEESAFNDFSSETVLTATSKPPKFMNDIFNPDMADSVNVKINKNIERPAKIEIKKTIPKRQFSQDTLEKTAIDEIQNVWQRRQPIVKKPLSFPISRRTPSFSWFFSNLFKKTFLLYGLAVVVIFGLVLYISMGKAEINIKPRAHSLDLTIKVTASCEFTDVDHELKRIPGQLLSVDKKVEEIFPATGEKDVVQKARGRITVYNEYGTSPQILIATTRFESENGLIFRTLKTITVPGTTVKNGQITPGSIDVEVIADKAGDIYNIGSSKFTIPAFKEKGDMDRHDKFYGRSGEAMKGGIVGKAKVVTELDYINAKKEVQEKIITEAEQDLKNKASGLKILSLPKPEVRELISSAQVDEAADSFTVSGMIQISTVGFKESDLDSMLASYIQSINDVKVLFEKLELKFENEKFNEKDKIIEFNVLVKGFVYSKIDEEKIAKDLMGKGEDEIREYIKTIENISSAKVILSPFWIWKVPNDKNKINIKTEY